jgi:hypothetical protein
MSSGSWCDHCGRVHPRDGAGQGFSTSPLDVFSLGPHGTLPSAAVPSRGCRIRRPRVGAVAAAGSATGSACRAPGGRRVMPQPITQNWAPVWRPGGGAAGRGAPRGAGQRCRDAEHQPAEVGGVQAVGVLGGGDQFQYGVRVEMGGQRQLDDEAGAGGVGVQLQHGRFDAGPGGGGRKVDAQGGDADLGAVPGACRRRRSGWRGRRRPGSCPGRGRHRAAAARRRGRRVRV